MRRTLVLVLASWLVTAAGGLGCGTEPVGVESCRTIEQRRCELAPTCGVGGDVAACKRFYRDQCLHGLSVDADPGKPAVDKCVAALDAAATCAKHDPASPCASVSAASGTSSCSAILKPELLTDCAWMVPLVPTTGAAGAAGGAGTAGAGGS